jgi:hypothetical protein
VVADHAENFGLFEGAVVLALVYKLFGAWISPQSE